MKMTHDSSRDEPNGVARYLALVPDFQPWRERRGDSGDWRGYQAYVARVGHVLAVLPYLWPPFVEIEGLVLNRDHLPREDRHAYLQQFRDRGASDGEIEYIVNHVHVPDMFLNDPDRDAVDAAVYTFFAGVMAEMWAHRLRSLFPGREFAVGVADEESAPQVYVYTLARPT